MKKLILAIAVITSMIACTNKEKQNAAIQRVKQAAIDSVAYANKQQRKIDSLEALTRSTEGTAIEGTEGPAMVPLGQSGKKVGAVPRRKIKTQNPAPTVTNAPTAGNAPVVEAGGGSAGGTTVAADPTAPVPEKKKGLNNAAKGAIIGLGTGAAAGAIIGKENRGKGAIIGGVAGAIGGAVGGAVLENAKQRKQPKEILPGEIR